MKNSKCTYEKPEINYKYVLLTSGYTLIYRCRKTQGVFDKCMKDNFDMDRPEYGYFARAQVQNVM